MLLPLTMLLVLLTGCTTAPRALPDTVASRQHAEAVFQQLPHEGDQLTQPGVHVGDQAVPPAPLPHANALHRPEPYLRATGYGDLSKGATVCQRVADMAARAELAKLVRVQMTEHATDRIRERTGQDAEQEIEIVREERANELLQDVRIVDRQVDRAAGRCTSTAVMPSVQKRSEAADPGRTAP